LDNGDQLNFDSVVLATEWPAALKLLGLMPPLGKTKVHATSSQTWYFALPEVFLPVAESFIILNATGRSFLESKGRHEAPGPVDDGSDLTSSLLPEGRKLGAASIAKGDMFRISNIGFPSLVQRSYAPTGQHLCAVTVMCVDQGLDSKAPSTVATESADSQFWPDETWIRTELVRLLGAQHKIEDTSVWQLLDRAVIDFHQPTQAPDTLDRLLTEAKFQTQDFPQFFCCGDWRSTPTLDGAMLSGRHVASQVREYFLNIQ
jgi:hypothetical protein